MKSLAGPPQTLYLAARVHGDYTYGRVYGPYVNRKSAEQIVAIDPSYQIIESRQKWLASQEVLKEELND